MHTAPRLYNTLNRRKEPLVPLRPPQVGIYACGPTVYNHPHLGNFRYFVWVDLLVRALRWRGFDVRLVMNITDVDDKIIAGAAVAGEPIETFAEPYIRSFMAGLEALQIEPASDYPRATRHIPEMITLVERLLDSGHAYRSGDSVFFSVASYPEYGRLARLDPDEMRSTERVVADDFGKNDPRDFALWKEAKPEEPAWEAPFGRGRPGWHLECSAMSMRYLGETFDIHAGGADLTFPHHENEIAQSRCATDGEFARMWLHCSHLVVDGVKMSKSLGNFRTLEELLREGHDPVSIRYLLSSVHYRRQLNFTADALEQASAAVQRVRDFVLRAETGGAALTPSAPERSAGLRTALETARGAFAAAIDDDLNTAGALGHLFTLVREANTAFDDETADAESLRAVVAWLREVDAIWGILPVSALTEAKVDHAGRELVLVGPEISEELFDRVVARARARADRDFAAADALRDELRELGIEMEDTPQGARWKILGNPAG
jgi:cysteinyl-tRNA synthetase